MARLGILGVLILALAAPLSVARAETPLEALRKSVADAYAKVDSLSISCFTFQRRLPEEAVYAMGSVEVRFSRATRQLAIGSDGIPELLVEGNRLRLFATGEIVDPVYLNVATNRPMTWDDVDAATTKVQRACTLGQPSTTPSLAFALPFLEGGMDRLFTKTTTLIDAADQDGKFIVGIGHPEGKVWIGEQKALPKPDPARNPICVRTKSDAGTWEYAFNRETHLMTAARGVMDSDLVTGLPGRKFEVVMIKTVSFNGGPSADPTEVPLELPKESRSVQAANLHAAYVAELKKNALSIDWKDIKAQGEGNLKSLYEKRSALEEGIAVFTANGPEDNHALAKMRADLKEIDTELLESGTSLTRLLAVMAEIEDKPANGPTLERQTQPSKIMAPPSSAPLRARRRFRCR